MVDTVKQKIPPPSVDYRRLRTNNLNSKEFKHLKLLIFWPVFGILFLFAERFYQVEYYYPMHCSLDDLIPFCEWFIIPYMIWFIYLIGMHIYTLLYDVGSFKKMMKFIIITYSVTLLIYFIFPTCQELRPVQFERDNILTRFIAEFYQFDTNTNVCPSIHVIGSLAVMFTAFHCKRFNTGLKAVFGITAFLICISTVFLKQHSVIDVIAALPICLLAYYLCFLRTKSRQ